MKENLKDKIKLIQKQARKFVKQGCKIIFLSDCDLKDNEAPIPMPLVVSAVHNYLVEQKLRS